MFLNRGRLLLLNNANINLVFGLNKKMSIPVLNRGVIRFFGSHEHAQHGVEGEHGHSGHDDHGHHEITGEVDLSKVYVKVNAEEKPFVSLTGIKSVQEKVTGAIGGGMRARNATTPIGIPLITSSKIYHRDLADVFNEDNPYFHPEPYGYLVSDDPFDPNPSTWQANFVLLIGFCALLFLSKMMILNNSDKNIIAEEIYHAHYTANLIEDELRRIRKEDYPLRKKYDQSKNRGQEENQEEGQAETD